MTCLRPLSFLVIGVGAVVLLQGCKKDSSGNADLAPAADFAPPADLSVVDQGINEDLTPAPDLAPLPCTAEITSCAGLCGKVIDSCTGTVFQCGGCEGTQVCDLDTHTCIEPKVDCEDFGAQCGEIKNSCGRRLNCGNCATGKECDPDTKTCGTCQEVSCNDVGFQCGKAWLGCGSPQNDADLSDCGTCEDGSVCNEAFHICEPSCTPPQTTEQINAYCAEKKTSKGVECGYITDGCGGLLFCGECGPGEKCGQRGVANRCEPDETPVECQALGKECGTITSKCDSQVITCGQCPEGEVCNENGICGEPCQPKICAELLPDGAECGNFADDGCGAAVTCNCGNGKTCGADGKCADLVDCGTYTTRMAGQPCSNGGAPAFPKGDGTNLTCTCNGSSLYCVNGMTVVSGESTGTCCQDTGAKCTTANNGLGGVCNPTNSCTGMNGNGCCHDSTKCDTGSGKCIDKCASHNATGGEGAPCSTANRGYFDNWTCGCSGGRVCVGDTASSAGTCVTRKTCGTYGANGAVGNPCSRGNSSSFSDGAGSNLTCDCGSGLYCVSGTAGNYVIVPTDGTTGTCRAAGDVDPNDGPTNCAAVGGYWDPTSMTCCRVTGAHVCTNDASDCGKSFPTSCAAFGSPPVNCQACGCEDYTYADGTCTVNGTQTVAPGLSCGCRGTANGQSCRKTNSTADQDGIGKCCPNNQVLDANDNCVTANTCSSLGKATNASNGANDAGKACNDNAVYDRNDGGSTMDFSCKCGTGNHWENQVCSNDQPVQSQNGSCTCAPKTACTTCAADQYNGCGDPLTCCPAGKACVPNGGNAVKCCEPYKCDNLPPGTPSGFCGTINDGCQLPFFCGCSGGNVCNSSMRCQAPNTCASLGKTKQIGSACNDNNYYDRGDGQKFSCGCDRTTAPNNTCTGDSPTQEGTCTCVPKKCGTELPCGPYTNDGCGNAGNCAC